MRKKQLQKKLKYDTFTGVFFDKESGKPVGKLNPVDGHMYICIDKNKYRADKLAWLYIHGSWPEHDITHIDGVNTNNWASNLKKKPDMKPRKDNKLGIPGVSWDKRDKKFRAQISKNGVQKNLGNYEQIENAILARYRAEQELNPGSDSLARQYIEKMFM